MMFRIIPQMAGFITVSGVLVVLLALGLGWLIPTGQQMAFASAQGWHPGPWEVRLLDVDRVISQRLAVSDTRSNPGLPISWSPDGQTIAYMNYVETRRTFFLDGSGGIQRLLNPLDMPDAYNLAWSPDGRKFAFVGGIGNQNIYVADSRCVNLPEGCAPHLQRLTERPGGYINLAWAPDGQRLVFEYVDERVDLYLLDVECPSGQQRCRHNIRNLTDHEARDMKPAWSPDGRWIAFMSNRENSVYYDLYVLQADASENPRLLTSGAPADTGWEIHWSPDSRKIVFGSAAWTGGEQIFLIDLETNVTHDISESVGRDANPAWSPDGRWIAFESTAVGSWDIYMVDPNGENRKRLTDGQRYNNRLPIWSPDSRRLAFISNAARSWDIYVVTLNHGLPGAPQRLTYTRDLDVNPVWRPQ